MNVLPTKGKGPHCQYDTKGAQMKRIEKCCAITYCVLLDKMESKIQKKLTNIGFDITMTKHLFLLNYKTIKVQTSSN